MNFEVQYLQEAVDFLKSLDKKTQEKILYNIEKAKYGLDAALLSKLDNDIWEFRTLFRGKHYRLLCFWDTEENTLIIATNGFIKKTQKTPEKEIDKAKHWRTEYFKSKKSAL